MKALYLLVSLIFLSGIAASQTDSTKIFRVILTDGSEFNGKIVSEDSSRINFITLSGAVITVEKSQIDEKEEVEVSWRKGEYLYTDPNQARLFFSPTARTVKAGKGYFSTYELFFPFLSVGLADFITISGGVSLFPGAERQLYYVTPKVRLIHLNNFDLSSGFIYINAFEAEYGVAYGVFTLGSSQAALTAGLGWGVTQSDFSENPLLMLGGELQLSNHVKLITENWIPTNSDLAFVSVGLRFFGSSLAADFAFVTTTKASGDFPFIPWVGFAYNF